MSILSNWPLISVKFGEYLSGVYISAKNMHESKSDAYKHDQTSYIIWNEMKKKNQFMPKSIWIR